ncbi:MAG: flagellar basal body-associated FliL family protein [Gammaproteobacteria bacterium]|nr:flagellar basal body-associated FliL family protein [Gammaproteobacteria bacterium]
MAAGKLDDDLDLGIEQGKGSKKKIIILGAVGIVFLLLAGLGAAWLLMGEGESSELASASGDEQTQPQKPHLYHPLEPLFIVNMPPGSKAKLLQVGLQVMTRDQAIIDFVQHNDPMIRHNLLNLLGTQSDEVLKTRAGKEKLQQEVVKNMNQIIKKQGGPGEVEAVYFTTFVMQ